MGTTSRKYMILRNLPGPRHVAEAAYRFSRGRVRFLADAGEPYDSPVEVETREDFAAWIMDSANGPDSLAVLVEVAHLFLREPSTGGADSKGRKGRNRDKDRDADAVARTNAVFRNLGRDLSAMILDGGVYATGSPEDTAALDDFLNTCAVWLYGRDPRLSPRGTSGTDAISLPPHTPPEETVINRDRS